MRRWAVWYSSDINCIILTVKYPEIAELRQKQNGGRPRLSSYRVFLSITRIPQERATSAWREAQRPGTAAVGSGW